MARLARLEGVAVRGIAAALPRNRQSTGDCPSFKSAEEAARFAKTIGIRERRVATDRQCASDLCAFAADALLNRLSWNRAGIGLAVMVTQGPDYSIPATAILLQHRLGLSVNTIAFDINLGCSAFPFGLAQVASMMCGLGIQRGLLMIGDVSSRGCNVKDPSSYPLFGDAGSAVALELDSAAGSLQFDLHSDGSGGEAICAKSYGLAGRHPVGPRSLEVRPTGDDGYLRNDLNTRLKGAEIFSFSIREASASISAVLDAAGQTPQDIDVLVLHQANKMINDLICRKAGFGADRVISSLEYFGNTGSASIPVTLCSNSERLEQVTRVLACGFGVGLSWGSVLLELAAGIPLLIIETDDVFRADLLINFGDDG